MIQMPVHRGYNYLLPRDDPILMYLLSKTCMYSMTVRFMERVQRGRLLFAKMRGCSDMKPDQRRACYRLPCDLPVMVERVPANRMGSSKNKGKMYPHSDTHSLHECQMLNFSDGGMLFAAKETFEIGEKVSLAFDIGTDEVITAEVLRCERMERADVEQKGKISLGTAATNIAIIGTMATDTSTLAETTESKTYCHKIAVKFTHKCKKQKNRFYKCIVNQQFEEIKRQAEQNAMLAGN